MPETRWSARRALVVIPLVLVFVFIAARPAPARWNEAKLDRLIERRMAIAHVPGLAVGIVKNASLAWAKGYGWAHLRKRVPVTPRTLFIQASVSKTVTGTALMTLYDAGLVALDDDIDSYLPFPVRNPNHPGVPITVRQLLSHTSSLADNWNVLERYYTRGDSPIALGDFLRGYLVPGGTDYDAARNFLSRAPGTRFEYSNVGYALIGYLVERITGTSFAAYCNSALFAPLGMVETSWFLADLNPAHVAMPYRYNGKRRYSPYGHYGFPDYPNGQLRTSVAQMANFLIMLVEQGRFAGVEILRPATVTEMKRVQFPKLARDAGLALFRSGRRRRTRFGHDGGDDGARTEMWFRPMDGIGVLLMANGDAELRREDRALLSIVRKLFRAARDL